MREGKLQSGRHMDSYKQQDGGQLLPPIAPCLGMAGGGGEVVKDVDRALQRIIMGTFP